MDKPRGLASAMKPIAKVFVIGCPTIVVLVIVLVVGVGGWLISGPESSVKLDREMDRYALGYIADYNLLNS